MFGKILCKNRLQALRSYVTLVVQSILQESCRWPKLWLALSQNVSFSPQNVLQPFSNNRRNLKRRGS